MPAKQENQQVVMELTDLQVVLNYLAARPYSEVFNVIETIKKARPFEAVVAEQNPNKDQVVTEDPQQK